MAYLEQLRARALEDWRHETLVWAASTAFASRRPPQPAKPLILRDGNDDDDA
jgi:hypothetical protein